MSDSLLYYISSNSSSIIVLALAAGAITIVSLAKTGSLPKQCVKDDSTMFKASCLFSLENDTSSWL